MTDAVIQITQENHIYTLTIHRPEALNALNKLVFNELEAFFTTHANDPEIKGVIITGAGEKAFVAGADIKEFSSLNADQGMMLSKRGQDIFFLIERFHVPVIAAVNGFALGGGCELAMACHLRIASQSARFGQPEVNLGLIPGYGGSQRLPQLIGKAKAMELLLTGNMVSAEEAFRLGLVNEITDSGNVLNRCREIIQIISTKAPLAIKETIRILENPGLNNSQGYEDEHITFGNLLVTEDSREGASAFAEKRKPSFLGK
ncbi:MAG: enoyl-CoA hydratase-related protein [Saprospiraceae bacterium]|jgi:enoyl-CoA hydratase|nr:enoyl-CoA hydratase-related protein [Saprospiraceae bacterium]